MIAIKHSSASNMDMLTHKGATLNDPFHIANIFKDYFSSIAEKTKLPNFWRIDILHCPHKESLFVAASDAHEVNINIFTK